MASGAPAGRAVVLLSGGLDSGVALAMWLARPEHTVVLALTADYGQQSAAAEQRAARRLAERFGVPWRALELPWLGDAAAQADCALL
ncbi:MAG: 7-cyano-7-deazaguanine synthase, partial [Planctomycetes bacterium]|nr:7-cyano-7-deazaguanine synthase [Planctomycetota bacterium]